ncbi:MAG: ABC transporter ATP-binding protein [Oxalobacteraceae bacterium]|nr:ABC transporter ATP-binding protein [Oxalobacteraceae bacterium]
MSNSPLLVADKLCTYYGHSQALFDVSLSIPAVGGVAILGRNGAGKTTLLKTIAGELLAQRGSLSFDDENIDTAAIEQRAVRGVGYVPQDHGIFARLTVRENLQVGAMRQAKGELAIDEMVALFPRLGQRMAQAAGTLSGGERKMLAISRALLGRPRMLLLDEPTEGVWHGVIEEITERLRELAQTIAVVIVEQHVKMALSISQHCYVMDRGQIALSGVSATVRDDPELERLLSP